ncbi:MAG TPA: toxin-antitoxin system YwqK family antitoxin [Bacteroidia bacterium]|nr:toxin-antitoxin system YwqK family antitoxin [Bacteroidia bacterium]
MKRLKINQLKLSALVLATVLSGFAAAQVPTGLYPNKTDSLGKQGAWKKTDDQGTCVYVGQFKNDKPYGIFQYFDTQGYLMTEMNFFSGGNVQYAKMYYQNGKMQAQGKYLNQKKDSLWSFYDDLGELLSEEWYKDGLKNGKSITYHPGTKQPAEVKTFKNGLEEGAWIQYYADGKIKGQGTYVAGNYEGKATWYYPDGSTNITGFYQHAVKNGTWLYYDETGKLKGKETWVNGKLTSEETVIKKADFDKQVQDDDDPATQGQDPNDGTGGN